MPPPEFARTQSRQFSQDCRKTAKSAVLWFEETHKHLVLQEVKIARTPLLNFFDSLVSIQHTRETIQDYILSSQVR